MFRVHPIPQTHARLCQSKCHGRRRTLLNSRHISLGRKGGQRQGFRNHVLPPVGQRATLGRTQRAGFLPAGWGRHTAIPAPLSLATRARFLCMAMGSASERAPAMCQGSRHRPGCGSVPRSHPRSCGTKAQTWAVGRGLGRGPFTTGNLWTNLTDSFCRPKSGLCPRVSSHGQSSLLLCKSHRNPHGSIHVRCEVRHVLLSREASVSKAAATFMHTTLGSVLSQGCSK